MYITMNTWRGLYIMRMAVHAWLGRTHVQGFNETREIVLADLNNACVEHVVAGAST